MAADGVFGWSPVTVTTLASNSGVCSSPTASATSTTSPPATTTQRSRRRVRLRSIDSRR